MSSAGFANNMNVYMVQFVCLMFACGIYWHKSQWRWRFCSKRLSYFQCFVLWQSQSSKPKWFLKMRYMPLTCHISVRKAKECLKPKEQAINASLLLNSLCHFKSIHPFLAWGLIMASKKILLYKGQISIYNLFGATYNASGSNEECVESCLLSKMST